MREWANEETLDRIEAALAPPNRIDPDTGTPMWYGSDEDAWAEFEREARTP